MEIQGKIIKLLDEQSGESKNGTWRKREYILETQGQYPKKVCFNMWGDRIDQYAVQEGDMVSVSFDLESREFNSRWYTDVKAWKIEKAGTSNNQQAAPSGSIPPPPQEEDYNRSESDTGLNDLPF